MNEDVKKSSVHIHSRTDELIACLEGEIAKRDEELAACRVSVENCELFRARIAELEARIVWLECEAQVNAAPVSEAKAQGVVQWPDADEIMQMAFEEGQPADDASGYYFELEEFDLFIERLISEVARLNAAPVQQVSVPTWMASSRAFADRLYMAGWRDHADAQHSGVAGMYDELLAAPAAPAADGWIPVGERLPAVESRLDQECRVGTLSIAPLNVSAAVLVFDGEKVRSTRLEWFDGCLPLPYCITHWMPLPAAPAASSAKGVV